MRIDVLLNAVVLEPSESGDAEAEAEVVIREGDARANFAIPLEPRAACAGGAVADPCRVSFSLVVEGERRAIVEPTVAMTRALVFQLRRLLTNL